MCAKKRRQTDAAPESGFQQAFVQYGSSMTGIREFLSELVPVVGEMDEDVTKKALGRAGQRLRQKLDDFRQTATEDEIRQMNDQIDRVATFFRTAPEGGTRGKSRAGELSIEVDHPMVQEMLIEGVKATLHAQRPTAHSELLRRSVLMCLVSNFEVLVADLAHLYYRLVPDATTGEDKLLSVNELRRFDSIDDALQSIIADRVDELLRGGIGEWHKFFVTRMKIDFNSLVPYHAEWNEFFQRRHIMVHAGGRITKRYLANVDWDSLPEGFVKPKVGEQLHIDDAYLQNAIDSFEVAGLLLCQEVWKKLAPGETGTRLGSLLGLRDAVYRRLLTGNWRVAKGLAEWGMRDGCASEDDILICRFNGWLCMKRLGRWEEAARELEAFDTSAKHPIYSLVKASLLERADDFFRVLPMALGAGVEIREILEWPILEEMRGDHRFAEIINSSKTFENGRPD